MVEHQGNNHLYERGICLLDDTNSTLTTEWVIPTLNWTQPRVVFVKISLQRLQSHKVFKTATVSKTSAFLQEVFIFPVNILYKAPFKTDRIIAARQGRRVEYCDLLYVQMDGQYLERKSFNQSFLSTDIEKTRHTVFVTAIQYRKATEERSSKALAPQLSASCVKAAWCSHCNTGFFVWGPVLDARVKTSLGG